MKRPGVGGFIALWSLFGLGLAAEAFAAASGGGSVLVKGWTLPKPPVTGYNLYMAASKAGPWTKANPAPIVGKDYEVGGLTPGAVYWFRLTSLAGKTESAPSHAFSLLSVAGASGAAVAPPGAAAPTGKRGRLALSGWSPPVAGHWNYIISIDDGKGPRVITPNMISSTAFVYEGAEAGRKYTVKVICVGPHGERTFIDPWDQVATDSALPVAVAAGSGAPKGAVCTFERGAANSLYWQSPNGNTTMRPDHVSVGASKEIPVLRLKGLATSGAFSEGADFVLSLLPQGRCEPIPAGAKFIVADLVKQGPGWIGLGYREGLPNGRTGAVWMTKLYELDPSAEWQQLRIPLRQVEYRERDFACGHDCKTPLPKSPQLGVIAFRIAVDRWNQDTVIDVRKIYFE